MSTALIQRLEAVVYRLAPDAGNEGDGPSPSIAAFGEFLAGPVQDFVAATAAYPELKTQSENINKAWTHVGAVLAASEVCAQPEQGAFITFLAPIVEVITASSNIKGNGPFFNYEKAIDETAQSLNWIMMPGPAGYIESQLGSAEMYLNRILMKVKDQDDTTKAQGRAFVKTLKAMQKAMAEYAKTFHKSGIVWKFKGSAIADYKVGESAAPTESKLTADDRLEQACKALEAYADKMVGGGDGPPPSVSGWSTFLDTEVKAFVDACNALEEAKGIGAWTEKAFKNIGVVVEAAITCKNPGDDFMKILGDCVAVITAAGERLPRTNEPAFPHRKSFHEMVQSLSWIMMPGPPGFIQTQADAAQMYLNKILMKAKDMEDGPKAAHRLFVSTAKALMTAQKQYTTDFHKSGIVWKFDGAAATEFKTEVFA